MLFAAKIMDAKDVIATHGSQKLSISKSVETAGPNLSWILSVLVEQSARLTRPLSVY